MNTNVFLELFRKALNQVDETYYGIEWWNESQLNYHEHYQNHPNRQAIQAYLARYGERVFCYEFYYQLRSLMRDYETRNPGLDCSIRLQAELVKRVLGADLAELFGVQSLENEYTPDFLLHSPGDFNKQWLVIEVKSNPTTTWKNIQDDLSKIQLFITNYHYEKGTFLILNNSPDKIHRLIAKPTSQEWIRANLPNRSCILFMSKENRGSEIFECFLDNIPKLTSWGTLQMNDASRALLTRCWYQRRSSC